MGGETGALKRWHWEALEEQKEAIVILLERFAADGEAVTYDEIRKRWRERRREGEWEDDDGST